MNIARLQQAIDRIVPIRARTLGLEFQAAQCYGAYLLLHDGKGERRELKLLNLYRPCAPTQDAVTDTAIEMLSRLHERFGPGKVWTLGNSGAAKRIHVIADDGAARTNDGGEIMLRMFYVHEHSTIGPNEEDPESKWPWSEAPRQVDADRAAKIGQLNDDLAAGRIKVPAEPPVWNREYLGEWAPLGAIVKYKGEPPAPLSAERRTAVLADMTPEQRRLFEQPTVYITPQDAAKPAPINYANLKKEGRAKPLTYAPVAIDPATMRRCLQEAPAFHDMVRRETDRALNEVYAERYRMIKHAFESPGVALGPLYRCQGTLNGKQCEARSGPPAKVGWRCPDHQTYPHHESLTPAGRLEAVYDLAKRGVITQEQARELLETPAIEPRFKVTGYTAARITVTRAELVAETKYDGMTGAECLEAYRDYMRGDRLPFAPGERATLAKYMTPGQLDAARELWSLQLRARVEASKERDRQRVTVDQEID